MTKLLGLMAALMMTTTSFASILSTEAGDKKIENVAIAKSATANIDGQNISLGTIGAGLRTKKVLVMNVKVYVAQLFASDSSKFVRTDTDALRSLEQSRTIAISMKFLRTVEAEKVQVSFRDALAANNVNLKDAAIDGFLKAVSQSGEATESKTLTIITQKNADGSETVYYEDTLGKISKIHGSAGFSNKILSIWLGIPADDGLAKLKELFIKGV